MNRKIGMFASLINLIAVIGLALCMLTGTNFGSYITSIFIAFSFVPMMCAYSFYAKSETKLSGYTAMIFSGMYATIILLVYFAQVTSVRLDNLQIQTIQVLDYQKFGLFFNYDLLGYGLMSLSTFFAGLTFDTESKSDKWLKALLLIHGVFFIPCFIMPMLGMFTPDLEGATWIGTAILGVWCVYFIPVGMLSFLHFSKNNA